MIGNLTNQSWEQISFIDLPGGNGVSLGEGTNLVALDDRVEHLRELRTLLANERPFAALLHLPSAHHCTERMSVYLEE